MYLHSLDKAVPLRLAPKYFSIPLVHENILGYSEARSNCAWMVSTAEYTAKGTTSVAEKDISFGLCYHMLPVFTSTKS